MARDELPARLAELSRIKLICLALLAVSVAQLPFSPPAAVQLSATLRIRRVQHSVGII